MSAALDLKTSLTLTDKEIEAIVIAELERRGHTIEHVAFGATAGFAGGVIHGDKLGPSEITITAHVTVKL